MNMALDEACLRTAPERGRPLVRLYGWNAPAVSIGFFQKFSADLAPGRPLVRRPTGGGLVDHARDTTYTVVVPAGHALYRVATTESYRRIHEAVAAALRLAGWAAELAPCCGPVTAGVCFDGPVQFDVVVAGRKVAGAAQRRLKRGLLHQGSILLPADASGQAALNRKSEAGQTGGVCLKTRLASVERMSTSVRRTGLEARSTPSNAFAAGLRDNLGVSAPRSTVGQTGMSASRSSSVLALNGELRRGFEEALGVRFEDWQPAPDFFDLARSLCAEKYGSREWTERFRA